MRASVYDELAPHYAEYALTRAAYCDAVDRHVLGWAPAIRRAILDVGSGDGSRAVRLAAALAVSRLVLSDPSPAMAAQCRAHAGAEVWPVAAEDLPAGPGEFDLITCLWNVLGSVEGTARRVEALRRMGACLAPEGRIVLDVHNRYNSATTGVGRVLARVVRDIVRPSESNGSVAFTWQVAGRHIASHGYLFTPREMRRMFDHAGLVVVRHAFVNYDTGVLRGPWTGQMLFALARHRSASRRTLHLPIRRAPTVVVSPFP